MEAALRTRLLNDATVSGIVGNQVHWDERPQASAYPAIVMETVVAQRTQTHDGFDAFRPTLVQFNCFAKSKTQSVAMREAVIAAITPESTVGGVRFLRSQNVQTRQRPDNTNTEFIHCEIVEATVWHD